MDSQEELQRPRIERDGGREERESWIRLGPLSGICVGDNVIVGLVSRGVSISPVRTCCCFSLHSFPLHKVVILIYAVGIPYILDRNS